MIDAINYKISTPLKPHSYPLFFNITILFLLMSFGCFCIIYLPTFRQLTAILKDADRAFQEKNYNEAIEIYEKILKQIKMDKKMALKVSEVYFALKDDYNALKLLRKFTFNSDERELLNAFMPKKYQSLLKEVVEK